MMDLDIGWAGAALLLFVFLLLGVEDVFVWLNGGEIPGIEFFVASLVVLAVLALAVRQARAHPPARRRPP